MGRGMQNTYLRNPESLVADSHPTLAQRLRAMRRAVSSILLISFVLSPYGVLAAEPVADGAAPTNQRPLVTTVGTVPVVNIVPPGSNGISHNKYERFDVPIQGAVLNNSPAAVTSTLAGAITGNPNLTAGAARVILNEVTSNQPSSLLGQLEVAGPAARVVIANPNGITCDGCGFINTPHVQLAAARPFFEADKLRFELGNGRLDVGPLGLKALATRLDLIAGSIATTGPVESRDAVNMIAGGEASVDEDLNTHRNASGSTERQRVLVRPLQQSGIRTPGDRHRAERLRGVAQARARFADEPHDSHPLLRSGSRRRAGGISRRDRCRRTDRRRTGHRHRESWRNTCSRARPRQWTACSRCGSRHPVDVLATQCQVASRRSGHPDRCPTGRRLQLELRAGRHR